MSVAILVGSLLPISVVRGQSSSIDASNAARGAAPAAVSVPGPTDGDVVETVNLWAPAPRAESSDLPRPFAMLSASARSVRDSLVALARAQIGKRYRFGGTTPEHGFDCSGLVRYVMSALGVPLPRTAVEQARSGETVPRDPMQLIPGDLVTFGSSRRISHIGIYVGDGRFVQASSKAHRVIETPLERPMVPGVKPWRGVRRVIPTDSLLTEEPTQVSDAQAGPA